jgi:hypothetical protein
MRRLVTILFFGFALTAFSQDSTNHFEFNCKKGMEHYNKGVDIINKIEGDPILDSINAKAKAEFNLALPFLLKAYSLNSKDEKVLTALHGVYFGLENYSTADKYKAELELLKKKK